MAKKIAGKSCSVAINKTLAYRSIFNYPLSYYQLVTFLISKVNFEDKYFRNELQNLVNKKKVSKKDGKYYKSKVKTVDWNKRYSFTKNLIDSHKKTFDILGEIPWIKFIGVTGTCAAYNSDENSDIDLFVVTSENRIWLSRLFLVIMIKIMGKKPNNKGDEGKICSNIFVDETKLKWFKNRQNIYTAHQLVMMQPVVNKEDMYFRFMRENSWALKYFSNYRINFPYKLKKPQSYESSLIDKLENIVMRIQLWYMKSKKTTEITTRNLIHFNKVDHMTKTLEKYKRLTTHKKSR